MILVEIHVPAVNERYDFMLEEDMPVSAVLPEITGVLAKKINGSPAFDGEVMLCSLDGERMLEKEKTLHQNSVRDGHRLLVV